MSRIGLILLGLVAFEAGSQALEEQAEALSQQHYPALWVLDAEERIRADDPPSPPKKRLSCHSELTCGTHPHMMWLLLLLLA